MDNPRLVFDRLDQRITAWMAEHGLALLCVSVGFIFFWFGLLRFFAGLSPAQELATRTISLLSFSLVPPAVAIIVLAAWETAIGLGLVFRIQLRATVRDGRLLVAGPRSGRAQTAHGWSDMKPAGGRP
ncbi:MAG: hypothetical protein Q8O14_04985 [bacterium]|nr:hypothetical protein [bacterium]